MSTTTAPNAKTKKDFEEEPIAQNLNDTGNVVFRLVHKTKGTALILGIQDVINPKTQTVERMRLLTGRREVWLSEQEKIPQNYINSNLRQFKFEKGTLRVPVKDTQALDFLRKSPFNKKSVDFVGGRLEFFEWDPAEQAKERSAKRDLRLKAIIQASQTPFEELKKHAAYLKVSIRDEYGYPKAEGTLRSDYIELAELNPQLFLNTFGTRQVELSFTLRKAIDENKIVLGDHINWGAGGLIMTTIPGKSHIDSLLDFATSETPESKDFLSRLEQISTT